MPEARVTQLLELVADLGLALATLADHPAVTGLQSRDVEAAAHRATTIFRDLRTTAAELRLVPAAVLFQRLVRVSRDLERELKKPIRVVVTGGEGEIDKVVADRLFEPLLHIIRNAVDHGIESAEVREARGKAAVGTLALTAEQRGTEVVITIEDDGGGFDRERILRRALERGLVGPDDDALPDAALWRLLLTPGFSTAETVTTVSGRGVGLDVVATEVAKLRGRLELTSSAGLGATFAIAIPASVVSLDCLVVKVGPYTLGLPIDGIQAIVNASAADIVCTAPGGASHAVRLHDGTFPICDLVDAFGGADGPRNRHYDKLVVALTDRGRIAIPVTELHDIQSVVLKPLQGTLAQVPFTAGGALLASGRVAVIVDPGKVARELAR